MPKTVAAQQSQPFAKGSIIWEKKGPLPVWAWALLGLLAVLVFTVWRRNRSGAQATEAATGYSADTGLPAGTNMTPIFIVPQAPTPAVTFTPNNMPRRGRPSGAGGGGGGTGGGGTVPTAPPAAGRDMWPEQGPDLYDLPAGANMYEFVDKIRTLGAPDYDLQHLEAIQDTPIRPFYRWADGTGSGPYGAAYSAVHGKIPYLTKPLKLRVRG